MVDSGKSYTINGNISSSGGGALNASGPGTLEIGGTNTYGGGTTVNSGVLETLAAAALPTTGTVTVAGGQLLLNSAETYGGVSQSLVLDASTTLATGGGGLAVTWQGTVNLAGNSTVTATNSAGSLTLSGNLSGSGLLQKSRGRQSGSFPAPITRRSPAASKSATAR